MKEPIRILHVLGTVNLGGAESRIMELYRCIDHESVQFDFMVHTNQRGYFQDEIESLGGKVYVVPKFRVTNLVAYQKAWKEFFVQHPYYQAVHGHMTSTAVIYLTIAKKNGIPVTIAHARSAGVDPGIKGIMTRFMRRNLAKVCDACLACSQEAGVSVFGKKAMDLEQVRVLPNGIHTQDYLYDSRKSRELRSKLHLNGRLVIGHVGRFHYAKNHDFLIDIFYEIHQKDKRAILLLLGEGPYMERIRQKVNALSLQDVVKFLGNQTPVAPYYQAMDYFVFPSHYEGMPGSVVEAQCTGLPCMVSDTITKEVAATHLVEYISLELSAKEWADKILHKMEYERKSHREELVEKGFDVESQWSILQEIYLGT